MIPPQLRRARVLAAAVLLVSMVLPIGAATALAAGSVSLATLGATYSQDFDTLAATGTANTALPAGWALSETGTSARNDGGYAAGTGSDTTGDTYSFGASGSSERAFGTLRSGTLVPVIGASFTNDTGGTITSLAIAYTGEMWRAGVAARGTADRLDFQYSTDAASLSTGLWVDANTLDFSSPNISTTAGALDGNALANRAAIGATIGDLSIPASGTMWIRWTDFDIASSDDGLAVDDVSVTPDGIPAGEDSAPTVSSTVPADGSTFQADSDLTVTFSEPVTLTDPWFTIDCTVSGSVTASADGGPTTWVLHPVAPLADGEQCTLTVLAASVSDADLLDPPDTMPSDVTVTFSVVGSPCAQPFTAIPDIQGSGASVAISGSVTTEGVVVGDYEGPSPALRGFFIQDTAGDGNAATSDGIFVFEGSNADSVSLGDLVRVTGTAGENQGQSQISVGTIVPCGTATVNPTDISFPVSSATFLERYEGMLVRVPQAMYVTEHFQLGRFGEVVLSGDHRLRQPTSVVAPGAPAIAMQAANSLDSIKLDDASQAQNPDPILFARGGNPLSASNTLRGGDTATGIVGVLNYTWAGNNASPNAYRIRPINALGGSVNFEAANPRPTSAPAVGGSLRVVGMNLLNFFNTFDGLPDTVDNCTGGVGGPAMDCRGADTAAEFDRQVPKTVATILKLDADVLGINEIENDGYGSDSAIAFLVDKLNAATAPGTYAYIDVDAATGELNALGSDAIKVGMLYKPARVTPVGATAALNSVEFVNGGDSAPRSRPSLAQAFEENATGARVVVDINHLKSKGSACDVPDAGDGQGNCNLVRTNAAHALLDWLATDPTGTGDPDVLLVGDYNSYAREDPIAALESGGLTNLIDDLVGQEAYSYVFDGQWAYLDYAFGSQTIRSQVTGVADYHVNADEPSVLDYNTDFKSAGQITSLYAPDEFRVSDHDPVIVGLALNADPVLGTVSVTPNPVALGHGVTASAPFSDGNIADTHSATIDWGDGTTSAGTVTESAGSGTISGSHTYAATGLYTVTVTVTDAAGATDSGTLSPVAVYDPNGRVVTGTGWILSPAGAAAGAPSATGKATFALDAKYPKGGTVPSGTATFSFPAGDLSVLSTSLDWLVVSGSRAWLHGSATVNGVSDSTFLMTVVDGSTDRLRFQVWDASGALTYDNGSEQGLGGGSITIRPAH